MVSIEQISESKEQESAETGQRQVEENRSKDDDDDDDDEQHQDGPGTETTEWTELMGKDLLMKTVKSESLGKDAVAVQPQDAVVVDFVGRFAAAQDDDGGPIFQEAQDWLVVIGEKDVLPALEMGIRFMHASETAVLFSHSKFAYGPLKRVHGEYELQPNSSVRYQVTVKSIVSEEERSTEAFQIRAGRAKKEIGNDIYANEWSDSYGKTRALYLYKKAVKNLEYLLQAAEDEAVEKEAEKVLMDCLNNIVAVHMRAKEWHQAKQAAVDVLTYDPENYKALIRAAKAAMMDPASSYDEVEAAIAAAAEKSNGGDDAEIRKLRVDFKKRKQQYKRREKEMYSKMGKDMKPDDAKAKESEDVKTTPAAKDAEPSNATESADVASEEEKPWWKKLDWKGTILPYILQLAIPWIVYYVVKIKKRQQGEDLTQDSVMEEEPSNGLEDEF